MGAAAEREKGRAWLLAATGALAVLLAVVGLFHFPGPAAPGTIDPASVKVEISAARDARVHERVSFHDPAPLFLPTDLNASPEAPSGVTGREPGDGSRYGAQLVFPANAIKLAFPSRVEVPEKPVDVLRLWAGEAPFLGMGEKDAAVTPLPRRAALVEVMTADGGRQVLSQALTDAHPPGNGDWLPMEFLIGVDPTGLVGLPAVVPGSGSADVAAYFQNYLAKVLRVGERLPPGFYRIKVGP